MSNNIKFGYDQIEREIKIRKLIDESRNANSLKSHTIKFMNQICDLPVITVPIELPMYRLKNGRTLTLQDEYLATHADIPDDFFTRDLNSPEAQEIQHSLLMKLNDCKEIMTVFKDPHNKQTEPIICTNEGFVVNGNRRLCCWRNLFYSEGGETLYKHFEYIRIAILPECDEKAIDQLEADLQLAPDIEEDYIWHAEAKLMKNRRDNLGEDTPKIAEFYHLTSAREVEDRIEMLGYAEEYLRRNGWDRQWSRVTGDDYAFREFVKNRRNIQTPLEKTLFESLTFAYLTASKNEGVEGRLYSKIPEIKKYLPEIIQGLSTEIEADDVDENNTPDQEDDFAILAGNNGTATDTQIVDLIRALADNDVQKEAVKITEDIITAQKIIEREKKGANFLFEQVKKANTYLQNALAMDLSRNDIATRGLEQQLSAIVQSVEKLKGWLNRRGNNN